MEQKKTYNRISLSGLWLTVVLLAVLILATLALLASFILGYVEGDPNIIELMCDSGAMDDVYGDIPPGAVPGMEAEDTQVRWEVETSVDLFKTVYTGPDGAITVESADGSKLIAPGTSNSYEFTLKNTGNIALDYTLMLEGVFRLENKDIPMFVRLSRDGEWIMGGKDRWIHVDEMNDTSEGNTLPRGETAVYQFEWMWPYEMDDQTDILIGDILDTLLASDQRDTELGVASVDVDTDFCLNVTVTSEIAAGAIAEFDDGAPVLSRYILVCILAGLMLGSLLWLIILLLLRRNIFFTGLVQPPVPGTVRLDKKNAPLALGRFVFEKTRLGKHTLAVPGGEMTIRFKYSRKVQGLTILRKSDETVIHMGTNVRAVELYFLGAVVNGVQWAAIDKNSNVYTQLGMVPAVGKKNRTPGGLLVDEDGKFTVEEALVHV